MKVNKADKDLVEVYDDGVLLLVSPENVRLVADGWAVSEPEPENRRKVAVQFTRLEFYRLGLLVAVAMREHNEMVTTTETKDAMTGGSNVGD